MEETKTDKEKKLNPQTKHVESSYTRFPNKALSDDRLTKKDMLVLLAICSFLNNKKGQGYNTCYPSRSSIAKISGYSRADQIDDSISKLEECGYIVKVQRKRGEKANASNLYKVVFTPVKTNPEAKESPKKQSIRKALEQIEIKEAESAPIAEETPKPKKKIARKPKTEMVAPDVPETPVPSVEDDVKEIINFWGESMERNAYKRRIPTERDYEAVRKALQKEELAEPVKNLKELIAFIWSSWRVPSSIEGGIIGVDINILNTKYYDTIVNSYQDSKIQRSKKASQTGNWSTPVTPFGAKEAPRTRAYIE